MHLRAGRQHGTRRRNRLCHRGNRRSRLYEVNDNDSEARYFAAWSGKNRDPALGTLDVTATPGRLSARFVPAKGYTFTDAFTIEGK
jgi:hypothetical protein